MTLCVLNMTILLVIIKTEVGFVHPHNAPYSFRLEMKSRKKLHPLRFLVIKFMVRAATQTKVYKKNSEQLFGKFCEN